MHLRMPRLALHAAALALACAGCVPAAASPGGPGPALHVLMINGGGNPQENYASHLAHLRQMLALVLAAGVPRERIHVFASDGADPAPDLAVRDSEPDGFWLLEGTETGERLRPRIVLENSTLPGAALQPATRVALDRYFTAARARLKPGDTLLVYVTDHGTGHPSDPLENRITLWGRREALSVRQLRALLARLDPRVRVVTLMSQCFSGGFARLYDPSGRVCGYFASTADRPAYGCYPEVAGQDRIGHSFEFMEALAAAGRFGQAHERVLVSDRTPDVPLRTSDVFLEDVLGQAARAAGQDRDRLVDELLREAWKDRAAWEPDIRLLDRVGQAFGVFSPRSLAELERHGKRLPPVMEELRSRRDDWDEALSLAARGNLRRFFDAHPQWIARLAGPSLAALPPPARLGVLETLTRELAAFTEADEPRRERIQALGQRTRAADEAAFRMEVRLAVMLRLRTLLTGVAGRHHLATRGTAAERASFEALRRCEDLALPVPPPATPPAAPPPYPTLQDDLRVVQEVLPGWMGISFGPVPPARRARLGLDEGPALVRGVMSGSPAQEAGLQVGDVVLGPPGRPFTEEGEIKAWTMLLPIGRPQPLEVLRGADRLRLTLVPRDRPLELPGVGGPPKVLSQAPPVNGTPYRGPPPAIAAAKGPYLLFFWATWCVPCKEAVPELAAFARERRIPVIAITDEGRTTLDAFFARWKGPFPENVLSDEDRLSFLAYGVSGTPTFVLVDGERRVQSYAVGYDRAQGLPVQGWRR